MQAAVATRIDTTPSRARSVLAADLRTVRDPQLQELPQIVVRKILHCQGPLNIRGLAAGVCELTLRKRYEPSCLQAATNTRIVLTALDNQAEMEKRCIAYISSEKSAVIPDWDQNRAKVDFRKEPSPCSNTRARQPLRPPQTYLKSRDFIL